MCKFLFLNGFLGLTLLLSACNSDNKKAITDVWSLEEPEIVSHDGLVMAKITSHQDSIKKLNTSDKLRFKMQKGVKLHIEADCAQNDRRFSFETSRPLTPEIPIRELLPLEAFMALPDTNTMNNCTFEFQAYSPNKDRHRFFLKSTILQVSPDTESIQTYLNNKRLQPDSDSYQFIHLKKAHQIFIHTGLTGKYKLQLFCHNGISSEVNLINGAASIADFNLLPFYRRENKEQRIFKCRFFAFKNKRLKAISKYHRIHLPQPNIDIKIIDTSKWPKQKTHRHQFVGKVLRRMVIKNLGHEAYVLKIPLPVRQNAELNVFAREGSQIQKIGPKNIGLKYKLHWESKKALGKNLLKNNRHLIEVRLVPQAFILVDVSVKFPIRCSNTKVLGLSITPKQPDQALPNVHIYESSDRAINKPIRSQKQNKAVATKISTFNGSSFYYPPKQNITMSIEDIQVINKNLNFSDRCSLKK